MCVHLARPLDNIASVQSGLPTSLKGIGRLSRANHTGTSRRIRPLYYLATTKTHAGQDNENYSVTSKDLEHDQGFTVKLNDKIVAVAPSVPPSDMYGAALGDRMTRNGSVLDEFNNWSRISRQLSVGYTR